ncbi:MAG: PHP domain-containing protein, partial [Candidatus Obscuribacterales bacterium]|nr:PHP domain-containing protein [Candidatus Obscuribacterales bacterium]
MITSAFVGLYLSGAILLRLIVNHRYAELHCHSSFSLLDGASNPEELVARASEIGLQALALTDHDDLGGAVRFASASRDACLEAIIGAEITLCDHSHVVLLSMDEEGYKNICRLITLSRFDNDRGFPRVSYEALFEHNQGLIVLSGCPHGMIPTLLARDDLQGARDLACLFREVFADRFYLESWNHYLLQEQIIAARIIDLASMEAIPWVVSNNVHYATSKKRIVHDVLTCLRHQTTLSQAGRRLRPNGSWYMKSPAEMMYLWRDNPAGLSRTLEVAERCLFRLGS